MRWSKRFRFASRGVGLLAAIFIGALAAPRPQLGTPSSPQSVSAPPAPFAEAAKHAPAEFFVMIDPSHGGDDKGAMLAGGKVPEKDVSLALARELKRQLEDRGVAARLLRESDVNLSLERRAAVTNEERAGIYIALHAGPPGRSVRVYAPALALESSPAMGRFLPWERAQAGSLERSRAVSRIVANELRKAGLPATGLMATLRPLNNLITPAIAVEWVPDADDLRPPQMQRLGSTLAAAIASGIVQAHSLGVERQ